jgi:hydroxymethylpyrimidine/phosphomethylpyrimidine kinase
LITVQNTKHVARVENVDSDLVIQQIEAVVSDFPPSAAKTGALGNEQIVRAVAAVAHAFEFPLVVDPVMVSKHGARLLSPDAEKALRTELLPCAALVTPNVPEAEILADIAIENESDMIQAGRRLVAAGCKAVLLKGGHLGGEPIDVLCTAEGVTRFPGTRVNTKHTHGTGCTYSAAITAGFARGKNLIEAVADAKRFVQTAVETAPGLGHGQGPVNHFAER